MILKRINSFLGYKSKIFFRENSINILINTSLPPNIPKKAATVAEVVVANKPENTEIILKDFDFKKFYINFKLELSKCKDPKTTTVTIMEYLNKTHPKELLSKNIE